MAADQKVFHLLFDIQLFTCETGRIVNDWYVFLTELISFHLPVTNFYNPVVYHVTSFKAT